MPGAEDFIMSDWLLGSVSRSVEVNGITLNYVELGDPAGVPVILLHGFPEFWYSWRHQMPALAAAGYRVIAPDQRGYNRSSKTGPFTVETLTRDIRCLQQALGIERSHIVGHDWGAMVAWGFAAYFPEHTLKLAIMNGPHPQAYQDACRRGLKQIIKSWYMFFFQIPRLPEFAFRANNYGVLRKSFGELPERYMNKVDISRYIDAASQSGALTAMINWYRALPGQMAKTGGALPSPTITVPTSVIWGERDDFLDKICNDTLPKYVPDLELHYLPNSTHWVQLDDPDAVNELLLKFLAR
jgi:pimeloyl-ACP methyl ester carboxylesterase